MKNESIDKIVTGVILGVLAGAFLGILSSGMVSNEKAECISWRDQARDYKGFYLTTWQKAQCDANGIPIAAPVR